MNARLRCGMGGSLPDKAKPRGNPSHVKRAGPLLFSADIGRRPPGNSIAGAEVHQLPHPQLLIEIKCVAYKP